MRADEIAEFAVSGHYGRFSAGGVGQFAEHAIDGADADLVDASDAFFASVVVKTVLADGGVAVDEPVEPRGHATDLSVGLRSPFGPAEQDFSELVFVVDQLDDDIFCGHSGHRVPLSKGYLYPVLPYRF